ncbi:MAG: CsgG/HfaB family protein [Candidatus Brocadiaceae bacterium]|nr:CsgG/HfaB family protein [Candidatus Brocadiaceae bacterium]
MIQKYLLLLSICLVSSFLYCTYPLDAGASDDKVKAIQTEKGILPAQRIHQTLDAQMDSFAAQILQQLQQNNKQRVAVGDFTDLAGNITDIGKYISDEIITRLVLSGKLKVLDRQYFMQVLKTHRLSLAKALDPSDIQTLQGLLEIDTIITGTIVDLGKRIKINARLCETDSGTIFGAAFIQAQTDDNLRNLIEQQTIEPQEDNLKENLDTLALHIRQRMVDNQKKKLVVMELSELSGDITLFGKFFYEELVTKLMAFQSFEVLEKKLYELALEESEIITSSGFQITAELSKEIGEVLGADAIAHGTISNLGTHVCVNIKLINPKTAIPFAVATAKITCSATVRSLLKSKLSPLAEEPDTMETYLTEDEGEEELLDETFVKTQTKTRRLRKSNRIFFKEDFNEYPVGATVDDWGEGIVVVESMGEKGISSKTSGENTIVCPVDFPSNFLYSFNIKGTSWTWGTLSFYNSSGDFFKMDMRIKDNYFSVKFPTETESKVSCNIDKYNEVSIVKKGDEFQVYMNDVFVAVTTIDVKTRFTHCKITCRLDTLSLSNFSGVEL